MDSPASLAPQKKVKKRSRFLWPVSLLLALPILVAAGAYAWYYQFNACEAKAVAESSVLLVSQLKTYDAAYQFATTVSRAGLSRPVNDLQKIFIDTRAIEVPACMQTAKDELVNYMGTVIQAFQAYMGQEADAAVTTLLDQSTTHYDNFRAELEAVKKCAPYCAPWD